MPQLDHELKEDELKKFLAFAVDKIADKMGYKLSHDSKEELVDYLSKKLLEGREHVPGKELEDPKFLNKLVIVLGTANTLEKRDPKSGELLVNELKKLLEKLSGIDPNEWKNRLKKLEALKDKDPTDPEVKKELKKLEDEIALLQLIYNIYKDAKTELAIVGLPYPKPPSDQKNQIETEEKHFFDQNTNLTGLVDSTKAGSIAAVVDYFLGNFMGIPNLNPNLTETQLGLQTRDDDAAGNYLGLNQTVANNFINMGCYDDELLNEIVSGYVHPNVKSPFNTKLTPDGMAGVG